MRVPLLLFAFLALTSTASSLFRAERFAEPSLLPATAEEFPQTLNSSELIFGGTTAKEGQFPTQVFIAYKTTDGKQSICGGSLLTTTHVLTAAHCVLNMRSPASVMVGSVSITSGNAQRRDVHTKYIYHGYNPKDSDRRGDIAVVQFSPAVILDRNVQLAKIVSDDSALLKKGAAVVSGFGATKYGTETPSFKLLYASVNLFSVDYCRKQWAGFDDKKMICAGAGDRGTGPGDSGGPIQVSIDGKFTQVGLTSFGDPNVSVAQRPQDRLATVYTRISQYCNFINHATQHGASCV